jgi:hypothetical protein
MVTTPFANVGHAPLAVGRCVGSTPPLLEPPSVAPLLEPPSLAPLLDPPSLAPLLEPEPPSPFPAPLDEAVPPELVPPEPLPLLDAPLDPPSPPALEGDEPPLPHATATPATSTPTGTAHVFIDRLRTVRDGRGNEATLRPPGQAVEK